LKHTSAAAQKQNSILAADALSAALASSDAPHGFVLDFLESETGQQVIPFSKDSAKGNAKGANVYTDLRRSFVVVLEALMKALEAAATDPSEEQVNRAKELLKSWSKSAHSKKDCTKARDGLDSWAILHLMAGFKLDGSSDFGDGIEEFFEVLSEVVSRKKFKELVSVLFRQLVPPAGTQLVAFRAFLQEQGKVQLCAAATEV
jgi:hypothetical protein